MIINQKPEERLDDLQIKGYKILQNPGRFCFGMDAVLLSAFADVKKNERALDLGTGTGILAILAAMRGAEKVVGVEIDPAAYENAVDNIKLNDTPEVELRLGGAETVTETGAFDFVMANINRNIILDDIAVYARAMKPKGRMFLSGFYVDDIDMIVNVARALGLCLTSVIANKNWANICFTRIEDMNFTE